MTFQDRVSDFLNKNKNFDYLNKLINSDKKEVSLTSDVSLGSLEGTVYEEGILIENDEVVIDGNGHTIDACGKACIFKIENKKVTFKNINFINGTTNSSAGGLEGLFEVMRGGGAIYALESKLFFEDCTFKNCSAVRGGAVSFAYSEVNIDKCHFSNNECNEWGGAIFNDDESSLTVANSTFKDNMGNRASAIETTESSLVVINCEFENTSKISTIVASGGGNEILRDSSFSNSQLSLHNMSVIKNCDFKDSEINGEFGNIYIPEGETYDIEADDDRIHCLNGDMDWVRELKIHELPGEFLKYFPKFNGAELSVQNKLHDEMVEFVEIWREIWQYESNFRMADVIVNVLSLSAEDIENNYLDNISRENALDKDSFDELHAIFKSVLKFVDFPPKGFKYLDELMHENDNVALTHDICLDDDEIDDYTDGIKIDVNDLVIDGQNHVIDAKGKVSIFKIDGKNVTIKNLVFKNAFSQMGGAISNIGDVKFENCKFCNNVASELGGAIVNDEKMLISYCEFENNSSGGVGGAIAATFASDLKIKDSKFSKNTVSFDVDCPGEILPAETHGFGGAIYNNGKMDIFKSEFSENSCERNGGTMIVLPDSKLSIEKSLFKENHAKVDGGVIYTMGEINIEDSEFIDNSADSNAGVFDTTESSKLIISNSRFENNSAGTGNAIVNKGKLELIETQIRDEDIVDKSGEVDETQQALPGENETIPEESGEETSNNEFPEGYDDYARKFKEYFEGLTREDDEKEANFISLSLLFLLWASEFPNDANMIGAALLMENVFDEEFVTTILEDFTVDGYRKRFTECDPIDEEMHSWFMAGALLGVIFGGSKNEDMTSKEYGEKYINLTNDFKGASKDEQDELYDEIKELVDDWKEDFPDDINMSLAYITVNIPYLSDEKLYGYLDDLKGQSSSDEYNYERLCQECKEVLKLKNINLDDYLEE